MRLAITKRIGNLERDGNFLWRKVHEMFFALSQGGLYNGCDILDGLCANGLACSDTARGSGRDAKRFLSYIARGKLKRHVAQKDDSLF